MFDLLRESITNVEALVKTIESPFVSKIVGNVMRWDATRYDTINFHIEINCPFSGNYCFIFKWSVLLIAIQAIHMCLMSFKFGTPFSISVISK